MKLISHIQKELSRLFADYYKIKKHNLLGCLRAAQDALRDRYIYLVILAQEWQECLITDTLLVRTEILGACVVEEEYRLVYVPPSAGQAVLFKATDWARRALSSHLDGDLWVPI